VNVEFISNKIKENLPRAEQWKSLLDRMLRGETVRILARFTVYIDIRTSDIAFDLPDFDVNRSMTRIPVAVWEKHKEELLAVDGETWGILDLGYTKKTTRSGTEVGEITMFDYRNFKPYSADLSYFKRARANFTTQEWIRLLMGAVDYNADGYPREYQKLTMLTRLLPFVEKRLNLIELAPKGTGKSYVFSKTSQKGWLCSGGIVTRAKLLYDMKARRDGLVSAYDVVAIDEISTVKFGDIGEMQGALKGYLESGTYTVGVKSSSSDCGLVLLGNIREEKMHEDVDMFDSLPEIFHESALIDRFHGFIKGWNVPRMNEKMKVSGWALNTEYYSEIMHLMREDVCAKSILDKLLIIPTDADTRDTTAIKRLTSAYIKLLFPHWCTVKDVKIDDLERYCLRPAIEMRSVIRKQLAILDPEYARHPMATYGLRR
jgi:ATP-dependent Lon protease